VTPQNRAFAIRAVIAVAIAMLGILALGLFWYAAQVLLVLFAGLLVAVGLAGLADWVAARTRLWRGAALGLVVVAVVAVLGLGVWGLADQVAKEAATLIDTLPRAIEHARETLASSVAGRFLLDRLPRADEASDQVVGHASRVVGVTVGTTLGLLTNVVLLLFVALYVAANPSLYARGVAALVPRGHRARIAHLLATLGGMLRRWLLGTLVGMAIIGTVSWAGLAMLGVPLALALGVLAGLLNFVPYVGPLVSMVPAALLALLDGGFGAAGSVILLYLGVQTLEGYILTPLINRRAVDTPPALLLTAQVIAGVTLGPLGVVLAAPLLAVTLVTVKLLYVEDVLGDDVEVPGEPPSAARAA
jgi:predicted PurR-regulated permease PerM